MSTLRDGAQKETDTRVRDALADEDRRRIVRLLRGRTGAVPLPELADRLAAAAPGSEPTDDATASAKSLRTRLYHLHLPKLADCGLVEWNETERTAAPTDHPVYDVDRAEDLLSPDGADSVVRVLADDRRREVISVLEAVDGPMARDRLARELASSDADGAAADVDDVRVRLHHDHLPRLDRTGLVDYDPDEATVTYRGPSELASAVPGHRSAD